MKSPIEILIFLFIRFSLSLRYRVKLRGKESLCRGALDNSGGVLFLANHPAEIDPVIVMTVLWRRFRPRPLVLDYYYELPGFSWLMRRVRAFPVPSFQVSANRFQIKREETLVQRITEAIRKGEHVLLHPSGRLKTTGLEVIGGASLTHRLLQEVPEVKVVLIRTTGLWGSSFSRALTGKSPPFARTLLQGIKMVLKNLIFFTPRRDVTVEFAVVKENFPWHGSRKEMNRYLENWYNQSEKEGAKGESLQRIPYSRWRKKLPEVKPVLEEPRVDPAHIPHEIRKEIREVLARITGLNPSEIRDEMDLSKDLRLDSIDAADLLVFLEESHDVSGVQPQDLSTVGALMSIAAGQIVRSRKEETRELKLSFWNERRKRPLIDVPEGKTIQEIFLRSCDRMGKAVACADAVSGIVTYQRLKLGVLLLAQYLLKLPGERIGILLPASVAADMLILACMMAGKVPVMLNWTIGPRHLDRVIEISKVNVILSSWKFLERLAENIEFSKSMEDQLMMLEDIRRSFTLRAKLKILFRAKRSVKTLLSVSHLKNLNEEDVAVILFTSGSEALPKGVPLTHKNLLSNLLSVKEVLPLDPQDVIFGFLPPFHSFGFTVASLWPLLGGLKVAHSPNPTDGLQLAHDIQYWNATIVPGAPTFLREILRTATLQELKSVRLLISGAEKMSQNLREMIDKLGSDKRLIEGYGITECAPILTLTRLDRPSRGVGRPVPEVELCIVNPKTFEILPQGREGLILASGPNIFKGYLERGTTLPFLEIKGKQWYRTGDLGYLDSDGYLTLSGRMKRFVKIGGEMISLAALEEALEEALQKEGRKKDGEKSSVAVWAREKEGEKVHLALVTTLEMTLKEINQMLKNSGFGSLVKISHAQQLPEIPLLATGKIDYTLLEEKASL